MGKNLGRSLSDSAARVAVRAAPKLRAAMQGLPGSRARELLGAPEGVGQAGEASLKLPFPYAKCEGCGVTLVTFQISGQNNGHYYIVYNIDTDGSTDIIDHADMPHPLECRRGSLGVRAH